MCTRPTVESSGAPPAVSWPRSSRPWTGCRSRGGSERRGPGVSARRRPAAGRPPGGPDRGQGPVAPTGDRERGSPPHRRGGRPFGHHGRLPDDRARPTTTLRGTLMQKWEYFVAPLLPHNPGEILNSFGADGWELVNVLQQQTPAGGVSLVAYLKRPKS